MRARSLSLGLTPQVYEEVDSVPVGRPTTFMDEVRRALRLLVMVRRGDITLKDRDGRDVEMVEI